MFECSLIDRDPTTPVEFEALRPITNLTIFGFRLAVVLLLFYWVTIFVGTHIPLSSAARFSPAVGDKVKHFSAFAGLTLLLCYCTTSHRTWWRFGLIAAAVLSYGAVDELTQQFVPRRVPSWLDFFADAAGMMSIGLPYIGLHLWRRRRHERANPSDVLSLGDGSSSGLENIAKASLDSIEPSSKLPLDVYVEFESGNARSLHSARPFPAANS